MTFCVFSIIAFYTKIISCPKFGQWMFPPLLPSKNLMAECAFANFPFAVLKAITATVDTELNQVVLRECIIEREGKHTRD